MTGMHTRHCILAPGTTQHTSVGGIDFVICRPCKKITFNHFVNALTFKITRFRKILILLRCLKNGTIKMPTRFQIRLILQHLIAKDQILYTFQRSMVNTVTSCDNNIIDID